MRGKTRLGTVLMAGVLSIVITTAALAATPCERRQLWDKEFAYIDKISTTCRILTTGAQIGVGLYVPYPYLVAELGGSAATVAKYAAAFGVDLERIGFDKPQICRLVRAAARCMSKVIPVCGGGCCNTVCAGPPI
jgi:hypothetical protein